MNELQPCPEWCTDHQGRRARVAAPLAASATVAEAMPLVGSHFTKLAEWDDHTVYIHQGVSAAGVWPLGLYLGLRSDPDGVPRALSLGSQEARVIGTALLAAADLADEALPNRCACGNAIGADRTICPHCDLEVRKRRHASLRVVDGMGKE